MQKKILFVCGSTHIGGAEMQIAEVISHIRKFVDFKLIILGNEEDLAIYLLSKEIEFIQIRKEKSGNLFQFLQLVKIIKGYKPEILCTWLYRADILAGLAGKILGIKRIVSCLRNSKWPGFTPGKRIALLFCNRFVFDATVANSAMAASWHSDIGYRGKISVIPNYFRSLNDDVQPPFNGFHNPLRLGILSRPVEGKGHETLLESVATLKSRGLHITAYFMGFGIKKWIALTDQIRNLNLTDSVVLSDGTTNVNSWFNEIDIYLMGSQSWESDPNALTEAISMYKPCIISSLFENQNFDPPLESFKAGDSGSLVEAIENVMNQSVEDIRESTRKRRANLRASRPDADITKQWSLFFFPEEVKAAF
jgi:glycosyltransferase involved in cell wall biosynthesis